MSRSEFTLRISVLFDLFGEEFFFEIINDSNYPL